MLAVVVSSCNSRSNKCSPGTGTGSDSNGPTRTRDIGDTLIGGRRLLSPFQQVPATLFTGPNLSQQSATNYRDLSLCLSYLNPRISLILNRGSVSIPSWIVWFASAAPSLVMYIYCKCVSQHLSACNGALWARSPAARVVLRLGRWKRGRKGNTNVRQVGSSYLRSTFAH